MVGLVMGGALVFPDKPRNMRLGLSEFLMYQISVRPFAFSSVVWELTGYSGEGGASGVGTPVYDEIVMD
jgi:hypothetical protein